MKCLRAPLAAVCWVFVVLVTAPAAHAWDASVPPVKVDGNPTCADYGLTSITSGVTYGVHDTYYVKWTSTVAVDWVIVKGGPNANIYKYPVDTFGDDWLHAPINPSTGKPYDLSHVEFCGDGLNEPEPKPGIKIVKTGADYAYAGDTVTYHFVVTNVGGTTLTNVTVTDPRCGSTLVRKTGETDMSFDPNDVWNYSCTAVVPSGVAQVDNTATACGEYGDTKVCDTDDHSFPVRTIAIQVDKLAVEQTAVAGSTVHFTIAVKNTGNTSFVGYVFDDPNCDEQRTGANAADATLDPGETWTYACAMATHAGQTSADNTATATGTNSDDKTATDSGSASIPLTQPAGTPQTPQTPPQGGTPPPAGGTLPETVLSGRARLRGPSGCVKQAFRARVTGRSITSVAFYVDGKLVKRFTANRSSYSIKVRPGRMGIGRHRIVARVKFLAASGTDARNLPLTFRRCARQVVTPRFTG
jgi:hypothetical protein